MRIQHLLITLATLSFAIMSHGKIQKSTIRTSGLPQYLKEVKYVGGISSSYSSAKIQSEGIDLFTLTPSLNAEFKKFSAELSVPFLWNKNVNKEKGSEYRSIGRPMFSILSKDFKVSPVLLDFGVQIKLPFYSTTFSLTETNKVWSAQPMVRVKKMYSKKIDFTSTAGLEFSSDGEGNISNNATSTTYLFERVPVFNWMGKMDYHYDRKLAVGANIRVSSALGKHKLKVKTGGSTTLVDKASRDRMVLGVSSSYKLDNQNTVRLNVSSALKNEDTVAGQFAAFDDFENIAKLSASVSLTRRF